MLANRTRRRSMSDFWIAYDSTSCIPSHSSPIKSGLNNNSGARYLAGPTCKYRKILQSHRFCIFLQKQSIIIVSHVQWSCQCLSLKLTICTRSKHSKDHLLLAYCHLEVCTRISLLQLILPFVDLLTSNMPSEIQNIFHSMNIWSLRVHVCI